MLNRVITFHQNKEEERRLKTLRKEKIFETENEDFDAPPLPPLKRKNAASHSSSAKKLKVDAVKETTMEDNPPYCRKLVSKMLPLGENVSTSHQSRDHAPSPARNDEPPPSQDNHPPPDSPNNNQTFSRLSLHNDPPLPPHKSSISPNQHSPRLAINPKITTPHQ